MWPVNTNPFRLREDDKKSDCDLWSHGNIFVEWFTIRLYSVREKCTEITGLTQTVMLTHTSWNIKMQITKGLWGHLFYNTDTQKQTMNTSFHYKTTPLVLLLALSHLSLIQTGPFTSLTSNIWIIIELWARLWLNNDGVSILLWASRSLPEAGNITFPSRGTIITLKETSFLLYINMTCAHV